MKYPFVSFLSVLLLVTGLACSRSAAYADEEELLKFPSREDYIPGICALATQTPDALITVKRLDTGQVIWQGTLQNLCTFLQENEAAFVGAIGNCAQILNNSSLHGQCRNEDADCTAGGVAGAVQRHDKIRRPRDGDDTRGGRCDDAQRS